MSLSKGRKRILRISLITLLALLALPLVLMVLVHLRPAREQTLDFTLARLGRNLAGTLSVGRGTWPTPESIELYDVLWTDGADTLLVMYHLRLDLDVRDLVRGDISVRELTADCGLVNVPLLQRNLAADPTRPPSADKRSSRFLRPGALPPLPSISVTKAAFQCERLIPGPGREIRDTAIYGGIELRRDHEPELQLDLAARDAADAWRLEETSLQWAPAQSLYSGEGLLQSNLVEPVRFQLRNAADRMFELIVSTGELPPASSAIYVTITGLPGRREDLVRTLVLDGRFHAPGTVDSLRWPGLADKLDQLEKLPALTSLDGTLAADLSWGEDGPEGDLLVALDTNAWCDIAKLNLSYSEGTARLDTLSVSAPGLGLEAAAQTTAGGVSGRATWSLSRQGLSAEGALDLEYAADILTVRTTPLHIALASEPGTDDIRRLARDGGVRFDPKQQSATLTNVRLTGAFGEISLVGRWRAEGMDLNADITWPQAPTALSLLPANPTLTRLNERWREGAPWSIHLQATGTPDSLSATANLRLPGPYHVVADSLLPGLAEWKETIGTAVVNYAAQQAKITLDLSPTPWLESCRAIVRTSQTGSTLEDLQASILGIDLKATGSLEGESMSGRLRADIPDLAPLLKFTGNALDIQAVSAMSLDLRGTRSVPIVRIDLNASGTSGEIIVPELIGWANLTGDQLDLSLSAPAGLDASDRHLDDLGVVYSGAIPGRGDGRLSVGLDAADLSARLGLLLSSLDSLQAVGDTLDLAMADRSLQLTEPFTLALEPVTKRVRLDGLSMSGSLGRLLMTVAIDEARPSGDLSLMLLDPATLPGVNPPAGLRPDSLMITARASRDMRRVRIEAPGLTIGPHTGLSLSALITDQADSLNAVATILEKTDSLAVLTAVLSHDDLTRLGADGDPNLKVDVRLTNLPLPLPGKSSTRNRDAVASGSAALRGTRQHPTGRMDLQVVARNWPELAAHRLDLHALLGAAGAADAGLTTDISLTHGKTQLVRGNLRVPGELTLTPPAFIPAAAGSLAAHLTIDKLSLEEFAPFMPSAIGLQGRLDVTLDASGPISEPAVSGRLALVSGRASLPDGSWVTMAGRSELGGVLTRPAVTGLLEISSGVLRLPEPPQNLHPLNAKPLLWDMATVAGPEPGARPDSTAKSALQTGKPGNIRPEADIRISIPSGLWLKGQGLEIELTGDLQVRTVDGRQDIGGELTARRGFYRFLGRTFQVERGLVSFDAGEELDPALDISVTTLLAGGLYRVAFGGTLGKPTLKLSSEPELPEGDIMAMLLFGRPLEELSSDQEGLVQDRARDLVEAYGTAQLEARLSQQLKVDMVNLRRGGGTGNADALIIGKHLNRKVLLKYEQVLDEWSAFFVNMEYYMSRHLKLETMISSHDQSAAAVSWSIEY